MVLLHVVSFLKCQSLKEFGGDIYQKGNFRGHEKCNNNVHAKKAKKNMLIYITVNEAAVNSGKHHHGAVNFEL